MVGTPCMEDTVSETVPLNPEDSPERLAQDISAIAAVSAIPTLLRATCNITGMRFAAVARVTEATWTTCAVQDDLGFGLRVGDPLEFHTTLCKEVRETRSTIAFDHASQDAVFCGHHTPLTYNIESYVSVPIVLSNGLYFGNLCAIDTLPARVNQPAIIDTLEHFGQLIASELENQRLWGMDQAALLNEREVSALREQFIAVLAHDLRTPLFAISMTGHVLSRHADPVVAKAAERIDRSVKRMIGLVSETMDFARGRLGDGMPVEQREITDLGDALRVVIDEVQQAHPDRVIDVRIDLPGTVHGDRSRLQQVLGNLLSNAVTHGADGAAVEVIAGIADGNVRIEVKNLGEPILADELPKLFTPFWRKRRVPGGRGLGLGLFICSQVMVAHGGTLSVTSSAEDGTRFVASFPV